MPAGEFPGGGYLRDFINSDSESHTVGSLALGTDGALFVSIGDSASYDRFDLQSGRIYVGDVGWFRWGEINASGPGPNFGWPFYEGGRDELVVNGNYLGTPEADDFFASGVATELPAFALSHQADGIHAIVLGDLHRGDAHGNYYDGRLFLNDLGPGIVRSATADASGRISGAETFASGAGVVVEITEGPDRFLYHIDWDGNRVGRWEVV